MKKNNSDKSGVRKNRIVNISLLVFTTIIMLVIVEYAFRFILFSDIETSSYLRNPYYYSDHLKNENEDFYNEDYWKLNYLFSESFNIEDPNHLLGWTGFFDRQTLEHRDKNEAKGKRAVLLYGDSFAMCVDSVECFEDILNQDTSFTAKNYLLNYGVGGYGVDQIYLLFKETVDKFDNPFVVFSMLTTDMDRCMLKVRDAQKPYFVLNGKDLVLKGTPITLSSKEFFEQNPPDINSYLWRKFKSSDFYPYGQNEKAKKEYIEKIKSLNKAILLESFKKLKELNDNYVVLIFHPEHIPEHNWRLTFLREILQENEIPYICDIDVRRADRNESDYDPFRYAIKEDGHPTTYSNVLISNEIKRFILEPGYINEVAARNNNWTDRSLESTIKSYKEQIHASPEWLEAVKVKADEKGIPLDSMIYLDAKYMAEQKLKKE